GSHPESAPVSVPTTGTGPAYEAVLNLPVLPLRAARTAWRLQATTRDGRRVPVGFPDDDPNTWIGVGRPLVVGRDGSGGAEVLQSGATAVVDRCELEADGVRVRGRWLGAPEPGTTLEL